VSVSGAGLDFSGGAAPIEFGFWTGNETFADINNFVAEFRIDDFSVTVFPLQIAQQPQPQSVCPGAAAIFSIVATNATSLIYQWRMNGIPLAGATNSSLTLSHVSVADEGIYDVLLSNDCYTNI